MRDDLRALLASRAPREIPLGDLRPSAVMLLLVGEAGQERVVFQVRTQTVRHHKGEISLPGGRRDAGDPSFLHTALRETHEEVGIPPEAVTVLGALDDVVTVGSAHLVRPYVGLAAPGVRPSITAHREVRELLEVPLAHLLAEESRVWKVVEQDGEPQATRAWEYQGHVIWGATARIMGQFLDLLQGAPEGARHGTPRGAEAGR